MAEEEAEEGVAEDIEVVGAANGPVHTARSSSSSRGLVFLPPVFRADST